MLNKTFFHLWPAAALLFAGCSGERPHEAKAQANKGVIGISVLTLTNPFFKVIADTMTEEAKKKGYDVLVVSGDQDPARQANQVKDFIVRQCAAIVLNPCDSKAIGTAIREANEAGIPVFTSDIKCLADGVKIVSHIATDNYGGGKEAARGMIEGLGQAGGKIAIIHYPEVESCLLRVKGFVEVIDSHNAAKPEAKVTIVSEVNGLGSKPGGFKAAEDVLQAHPDLAGIFAINDPSGLGARAALEKAGRTAIKIIAFDGQPEGRQAIKEGKIYADPVQFPDEIGRKTVDAIVSHFAGEAVPAEILIPTKLYRQADAQADPTVR
ncbi:MAG: substrate-binding domain-containing protein [Verrucomicrobiales bacterium]